MHLPQGPLIIGEVLLDLFPGGKEILGGAPFNVAWHLQGLGATPTILTAVGDDPRAEVVLEEMDRWGLERDQVYISDKLPTGTVEVRFEQGQPAYAITPERAWEQLHIPLALAEGSEQRWLYHGSLSWRSDANRQAIEALRKAWRGPVLVDINIRQPWFELEWLPNLLGGADWIKMNIDELAEIEGLGSLTFEDAAAVARNLIQRHRAGGILLTCAAAGAYAITPSQTHRISPAPAPATMVDTVGAGDAFAAAAIFGFSQGWPLDELLSRASRFAAGVCGMEGATPKNPEYYAKAIEDWNK